jgi:L-fuculose-phosphate aldolase
MADSDNAAFYDEDEVSSVDRAKQEMRAHLGARDWPIQLKIALACRKLASEGHAQTLAGQVTVKAEGDTFWTNQLAGGFSNLTQGTVVRIDENMDVIEGKGIPNPGTRFHLWVYKARQDINAIVHTHPPYTSALAMTGQELAVAHMDTAMFFNDCAYLSEWPGVPLANEEGRIISEALGDKRSLLLSNHGLLTTGRTIEEAACLAVQFERAARLQIMAQSIGKIKPVHDEHAQEAHDFLMSEMVICGTFNGWADQILREQPDIAD